MANVSKPSGLRPVKYLNGAPWNGQATLYYRSTGDANAIYVGDPVTLSGDGDANGIPGAVLGTAGSAVIGVVVGVVVVQPGVSLVATPLDLTIRNLAASTAGYLLVADDPNIIFEIQEGNTSAMTSADIGYNCNFLIAAGATTTSDSGTTTAIAATAATATLNLKLLGLSQRPDNVFGTYAKWLVKINNHVYGSGTGTAGV